MNDLTVFDFEAHEVRVIDQNGEPWFVAKDVCKVLGISNHRDAISKLDADEKGVSLTDTLGGSQQTSIINESGLYTIVLRCRDATTVGTVPHRFRKWVTSEVLPSIRKTGSYGLPQVKDPSLAAHIKTLIELDIVKQEQQRIAMEVSDNTRRLDQIETAHDHFTIMGYMTYITRKSVDLNQAKAIGKKATKLCKERGIDIGHVPDPRFGCVHTYPKFLLDEIVG